MNPYSLSHLRDQDLLRDLRAMVGRERTATAALLAHIAEVDARRLFAPAGYSCMYDYCVRELRLSEDAALKRIRAARAARRFPAVFGALACGRLHLSGVALVAKYLTSEHVNPDSAAELLSATEKKTCSEIEMLLAERFPRPDLPAGVEPLHGNRVWSGQTLLAARPVDASSNSGARDPAGAPPAARPAADPAPWARVKPLSPERFALQVTIGQETRDKLEYAKALLGHAVPPGDLAGVLDRALDALVERLEKQKFAATSRPRAQRSSADPRHIPAQVKRTVWERDGGRCTFVGEGGRRCDERSRLEYDHVDPVACGGEATVQGIRLRCRAHNLYEAACAFGAGFMENRRAVARQERDAARARAAIENDPERSVIPWLRQLGFRLQEAREAALHCERTPHAPMEEKIKMALRSVRPKTPSPGRAA
jgi:hypothetical protein